MSVDYKHCFLCGVLLRDMNRSDEHIIPKWLQNKYNLWNNEIQFPNKSFKKYFSMFVPCCTECNGLLDINLERKIKKASSKGYKEMINLDREIIYLWLLKIFYTFHFKDLSYYKDPKKKNKHRIRSKKDFKSFALLHNFLQATRCETIYRFYNPYSLYIVKTHKYTDFRAFDFTDSTFGWIMALRMEDFGLICVFGEEGLHEEQTFDFMEKYVNRKTLHPVQFDELYAKALYLSLLFNKDPIAMIKNPSEEDRTMNIDCMRLSMSGKSPFDNWDNLASAKILHSVINQKYWKIPFDFFYRDGAVRTFFEDDNGRLLKLKPDDFYKSYLVGRIILILNKKINL